MHPKPLWKIIASTIVLSLIAMTFLFWETEEEKTSTPTPKSVDSTTVPVTFVPELFYTYRPGDVMVFHVKYDSVVQIQKRQMTQDTIEMLIEGKLYQRIYDIKANTIFAGFTLSPNSIQISAADNNFVQLMYKVLETEVFATFNSKGNIERWFFPEEIPADLRNTMKSLLLNIQVIFPTGAKSEWQHQEVDMNGPYIAKYMATKVAKSNQVLLFKQKIEYVQVEDERPAKVLSARGTIRLDQQSSGIQELSWSEDVEQYAMDFVNKGQVKIKLVRESKTNQPQLVQEMTAKLKKGNIYSTTSHKIEGEEEMRKRRLVRIIGNKTWLDLQKDLAELKRTLTPDKPDSKQRNEFYRIIAAWLELHPENMAEITQELLQAKQLDPTMSTLLSALTDIRGPAGQIALATVIEKRQDSPSLVTMAVSCLGLVSDPTDESIQLCQNLQRSASNDDVKGSATLALGSMIGAVRGKDPSHATALIYDMEKGLQSASSNMQKKLYLEALGNAGSTSSLSYIGQYIHDTDEVVSSTAVSSLRFIEDPQVDILLAQELRGNLTQNVRESILETLSYRKPNQVVFASLQESVTKESSENLRTKHFRLLWGMRKQFPQAEHVVKQASINDPSPKVRQMLQKIMLVDRD